MNKQICIFASTKFQIINAIHLTISKKISADLYIIDEGIYNDCSQLALRVERENIFQHVVLIKTKTILQYSRYQYLNSFFCYINYSKIVSTYLLPVRYDTMLFCTNSIIERLTRFFFIQKNNYIPQFIMFDEGVGSYLDSMEQIHLSGDRLLRKIIFKKEASQIVFDKFLYIPDLNIHYNDPKYGKIFKIPAINSTKELDIYNRIYLYHKNFKLKERIIFMDFPYEQNFTENGKRKYEELIKKLADFEKEELIIKKHPSDKSQNKPYAKYYKHSEIPFEIIIANSNIEDKILISAFSTAVVTPKMIFNKEPIVIILYKILEDCFIKQNKAIWNFFIKAKETYQTDHFYIPDTIEELFSILNNLKGKNYEDKK